ncbi:hypothetical protein BAE44_0008085 [Dichanthelium oligosanthes]|uniref:NAC domain-containing protein n=1 Tax=Dichanthelium oligosanthes TaxID=888268 RepID=A0A1E5W0H7_9POAL|nr:hypothetical protein BAE44_0008085 [Dichanthelium oligosanthes]
MAMAAAENPGGGFAVGPSDHDLITFVLRPMAAAGQQQGFDGSGGFIHLADVYSVAPEKLAERYAPAPGAAGGDGIWSFICPARCRYRARGGGRPRPGSRALSYGARTAAPWTAVTRHDWCMVELAIDEQDGGGGGGEFVLCKLFRSPRNAASASTAVPAARVSSCKRKAAADNDPEAPPSVRRQLMQRSF